MESKVSKTKPAPIQTPPTRAGGGGQPLSPDGPNATGTVLEYSQVTAAAYTIKKGVKQTPLEVTNVLVCVCSLSHPPHTLHTPFTHRPHTLHTPPTHTHTALLTIL